MVTNNTSRKKTAKPVNNINNNLESKEVSEVEKPTFMPEATDHEYISLKKKYDDLLEQRITTAEKIIQEQAEAYESKLKASDNLIKCLQEELLNGSHTKKQSSNDICDIKEALEFQDILKLYSAFTNIKIVPAGRNSFKLRHENNNNFIEYELQIKDDFVSYKPGLVQSPNQSESLRKNLGFKSDQLSKFFENCQKFLEN